jgi:hypothetical protein
MQDVLGPLFQSGRIVDLIIVVMVVEAIFLAVYHRRSGRGLGVLQVMSNFLAGLCLLVALRLALTGAPWTWIAASLASAFAAHLADLKSRWPS